MLWKMLNPTALAAHTEIYFQFVNWALEGGFAQGDDRATAVGVDRRAYRTDEPVQVWCRGAAGGTVVEAVRDGVVAARATLRGGGTNAPPGRAVFTDLPPAALTFRLEGARGTASPVVHVLENDPEMKRLAADAEFLRRMSELSGGRVADLAWFRHDLAEIRPKTRVEKFERVWRLWESWIVFTILAAGVTVEWIWRKLAGLI
jgi:hypothetical protein